MTKNAQSVSTFDHVLPEQAPLRQWVLTVPFELRARLAYDAELLGGVSRELASAVMDFYRRRFELGGVRGGKSGAVTVVQRSSSDLRLNPHYHLVALDGVYDPASEGAEAQAPTFHALPHLTSLDVAEVLQVARVRILRFLVRRGAVVDTEPLELGAPRAQEDDGLLQLAAAAVTGHPPAGPELREREPVLLAKHGEVRVTGALLVSDGGFTLHAATVASGHDPIGREALVRYALRPPLAQERLSRAGDDLVRIALKRPFSDGTVKGGARCGWRPWTELMQRVFQVDLEHCPLCGAAMKLRAIVTEPTNVLRYLRHLDEVTDLPPRPPARDPPYFRSSVVRRKLTQQLALMA